MSERSGRASTYLEVVGAMRCPPCRRCKTRLTENLTAIKRATRGRTGCCRTAIGGGTRPEQRARRLQQKSHHEGGRDRLYVQRGSLPLVMLLMCAFSSAYRRPELLHRWPFARQPV